MNVPAATVTPIDEFPLLGRTERDRRWRLARELMDAEGVDALVLLGLRGRESFDHYLSNEALTGVVVLPRGGDPVHVVFNHIRYLGRFDAAGRDRDRWITDIRFGNLAANVRDVLAEHGLTRGAVGVVGLDSRLPSEPEGIVPFRMWTNVQAAVPEVRFRDVSVPFMRAMLPKSAEELVLMRRAAAIGEQACAAFVDAVAEGARESEAYAAAIGTIHRLGATTVPPTMLLRSGPEALGWSAPDWLFSGGAPRVLEPGDVIAAEIFSVYGGLESQQQIAVSVGEPTAEHRALADVARASYDEGLTVLRAGVPFADLCDAMQRPIADAGCWNVGPLVQTVSPLLLNSAMCVGIEDQPELAGLPLPSPIPRDGDLRLPAGTVLAFEPNALRGKKRVCIGGTVIVTEDGYEELNSIPCRLNPSR